MNTQGHVIIMCSIVSWRFTSGAMPVGYCALRGLKDKPNYMSDVYIPGNIDLNVGRIGAQPNFGLNSTSGFQYQIDQAHKLNPAWFTKNPPKVLK